MHNLDDSFFNYFAASTIKTVRDLCQINTTLKPTFNKGGRDQEPFAIAGLIGLTSTVANGSIVLCFPRNVFIHLLEKMLGEKLTEITRENEDAAAELLNIIFGQAKTVLNKKGYEVQMAIPSVLRGGEVYSSYSKMHTVKVLPFHTDAGEFYIEFLLAPFDAARQAQEKAQAQAKANAAPKGPLDPGTQAAFFKPFMHGTVNTMKVQCQLECRPDKPFTKKGSDDYEFDIAGIIGITSNTLNGSFMVSFKQNVFLKLVGKMFGEELTEFQPGLEDAVSEIVNIIMGSAKTTLNAQGHGLHMAIPTVVHGKSIMASFQPNQKQRVIVIPFRSEIGDFHVELTIE